MRSIFAFVLGVTLLLCGAIGFAQDQRPQPDQKQKRAEAKGRKLDPARLLEQFDSNKDGYLDRSEIPERMQGFFDEIDANKDAKLSRDELEKWIARGGPSAASKTREPSPDLLFRLLDTNNDGKLSKEELQNAVKLLEKLDPDKRGYLELEDLRAYLAKKEKKKSAGRPGEIITPAAKGERQKDTLKVGDPAPDFTLPELKGNREITLSSFRGKKPVVLIFASYT